MDGAAKEITQLAQRILPERPHHLALSSVARHSMPSSYWLTNSPLQYTTYVSEADRGVLLTRPYYDIQLEPETTHTKKTNGRGSENSCNNDTNRTNKAPAAPDAASRADTPAAATPGTNKAETKKPVTKMSFKDYQQIKQQQKRLLTSPPPGADLGATKLDAKPSKNAEALASLERQRLPSKSDSNGDRKTTHSPSKSPRPLHGSGAADTKKRVADADDFNTTRPHKRSKSNTSMSSNSPRPTSSSKYADRPHAPPSPLDLDSRRDDRSRPTTNGQTAPPNFQKRVDRDRDKDRFQDRDRDKDKRDRDRGRERERERERNKERERERDKDRNRDKDRERERERERERDRARDRDRDRDRERERERERDRTRDANNDRDRDRDRDRDKDRDKYRDKNKDRESAYSRAPPSPSIPKTNGQKYQRADGNRERSRERSTDDAAAASSVPKAALPPILSPLHFNPEGDFDAATKRSRLPGGSAATSAATKIASTTDAEIYQEASFRIPPLLSPTLPAIVEQELSRLKKTPAKDYEIKTKENNREPASSSTSGKRPFRPTPEPSAESGAHKEPAHKDTPKETYKEKGQQLFKDPSTQTTTAKPSLIIHLKYKKKNVKRVLRLLALQPTPLKSLSKGRPGMDDTPTPTPPSATKKRPLPSDSSSSDLPATAAAAAAPSSSSSFKHPKTVAEKSVATARPSVGPGTPLKATPMARGTSNNSQILTPGDSASYTPRSNERPPTSQSDSSGGTTASEYRHRYDAYLKLGTKLKHDRDAIVKSRMPNGTARAEGAPPPAPALSLSEKKLVAALSLEMVMSYMIAFKSLNQARHLDRKVGDVTVWERLMPHLAELRSHARHFRALECLALQLRTVCFEQMMASFVGHEAETVAAKLMTATKHRIDAWNDVSNCLDAISDSSLKVVVGPWLSVEDTVRIMLPVLRRWSERENAGWEQELQPPAKSP